MTLDDALLAFARLQERFEGIPPSVSEFEEECGMVTKSHAHYWLMKLRPEGLIYTPRALPSNGPRASQLSTEGWRRARVLMAGAA